MVLKRKNISDDIFSESPNKKEVNTYPQSCPKTASPNGLKPYAPYLKDGVLNTEVPVYIIKYAPLHFLLTLIE
jgi:hypothetical protein